MKLLIDGDVCVYAVGASSEQRWYEVDCQKTGEVRAFRTKKEIALYDPDISKEKVRLHQDPFPEFYASTLMQQRIESWMERFRTKDVKIFLTDPDLKNNFRYKLYNQYKANRKNVTKPIHYDFLRKTLINDYKATCVSGIEADDALGMMQQKKGTVIISTDKDLLQVPGNHYNIRDRWKTKASDLGKLRLWRNEKKEPRIEGHGFKWFCCQVLMGDTEDNVPGLPGVGPVRAYEILSRLRKKHTCWNAVKKAYDKRNNKDLGLMSKLLWVLREDGDEFDENKI